MYTKQKESSTALVHLTLKLLTKQQLSTVAQGVPLSFHREGGLPTGSATKGYSTISYRRRSCGFTVLELKFTKSRRGGEAEAFKMLYTRHSTGEQNRIKYSKHRRGCFSNVLQWWYQVGYSARIVKVCFVKGLQWFNDCFSGLPQTCNLIIHVGKDCSQYF